MNLKLHSHKF